MGDVETQIGRWREYVTRGDAITENDVEELEGHLRDQMTELGSAGLSDDEAYLIAVKRLGSVDDLTREYAREHVDRLWKQLLPPGGGSEAPHPSWRPALLWAIAAGSALLTAQIWLDYPDSDFRLALNVSLVVLPFLAGYFAHRRDLPVRSWLICVAPFLVFAILVNAYPYAEDSDTAQLTVIHLPVVLWFAVGFAYVALKWRSPGKRMDFVRFTGEWLIYYSLIALGGGFSMLLTGLLVEPLSSDLPEDLFTWVTPVAAAGVVVVAAWLVEAKQRVVENMAPVLTMVFTPIFALMLTAAAITYAATGLGEAFDRELLTVLTALLVVVLGLVIFSMSAREPGSPAGAMDAIQLIAIVSALLLDLMVLGAMLLRIEDLGWTPNRAAVLGLNLLLVVNLTGAASLGAGFLRKRISFDRMVGWQLGYLPCFAIWATIVVVAFGPLFGFE